MQQPSGCIVEQFAGLIPDIVDLPSGLVGKAAIGLARVIGKVTGSVACLVRHGAEFRPGLISKMAVPVHTILLNRSDAAH